METELKSARETQDGIEVMLFAESDHSTSVAVRVVEGREHNTHAAVRLFYRLTAPIPDLTPHALILEHDAPEKTIDLVLSMIDVVPLITDRVASVTTFRVKLTDVAWVRVEPMRSYGQIDFFKSADPPL